MRSRHSWCFSGDYALGIEDWQEELPASSSTAKVVTSQFHLEFLLSLEAGIWNFAHQLSRTSLPVLADA